jgi:hypothetical protein
MAKLNGVSLLSQNILGNCVIHFLHTLQVRYAAAIQPLTTYMLTLCCVVFTAPGINNIVMARRCRKAVLLLSEFQLVAGIILLAIAAWKQHDISWIDSRFLLDSAAAAGWTAVMATMVRPGHAFRERPVSVVALGCYDVLLLYVGVRLYVQMNAITAVHHCIDVTIVKETIGISIACFCVMVAMQLSHTRLPGWRRLVSGLALLGCCSILEIYYLFDDYATFKPLIIDPVDTMGVSQLLTLITGFFPLLSNIWVAFRMTCKQI